MKTKIIKLPNGGIVIYRKVRKLQQTIVNASFLIRQIEPKYYGVAHFLEHMLFKGTTNLSLDEFYDVRNEIAPSLTAYTTLNRISITFKRTNKMIEPAFNLASDIILNPALDKNEIEKEKQVILKELKLSTDRRDANIKAANAETMADNKSFSSYATHKSIGDEKIINSMTRKKLLEFKNKTFIQNNFVCSVTTSLSKRKIIKLICETLYNKLPFIENFEAKEQQFGANKKPQVRVVSHERENRFSYILSFVLETPYEESRKNWNYAFASNALRKKLNFDLRDQGLTYLTSVSTSATKEQFWLQIKIETSKEEFEKSLKVLCETIQLFKSNPIKENIFESIKNNFLYIEDEIESVSLSKRNEQRLSTYISYGKFYSGKQKDIVKTIKSCTPESVQRNFLELINCEKIYMTILGKDLDKKDYPTIKQLRKMIQK